MRFASTLAAAALVSAALPGGAAARRPPPKQDKHYFAVEEVQLAAKIPATIGTLAKTVLGETIAGHARIIASLPADAPDPGKSPQDFKRYLSKQRLRAYRVRVEVTEYVHTLEPLPAPRTGQRLTVRLVLHLFGETIPDRVMAFAGDGAATVKLEIGRTLRPVDSHAANHDALAEALSQALDASLAKLDAPPPKPAPRRKKK